MSGRRTKELRRAFVREFGRPPKRAGIQKGPALGPSVKGKRPWVDVIKIAASRWKTQWARPKPVPLGAEADDLAVAAEAAIAKNKPKTRGNAVTEMFVRKLFSVKVTTPSEWRRWKKDHRRRNARARCAPEAKLKGIDR